MVLGWGAVSKLGVHDYKRVCMCVCVCWMQMWSCSCVVQSGCTRHATAERGAEIIHHSKQGTAQLLKNRTTGQIHSRVCTCWHIYVRLEHDWSQPCRNKCSHMPSQTRKRRLLTCFHIGCTMWWPSLLLSSKCCLLLASWSLIKQFANCLFSNNTK